MDLLLFVFLGWFVYRILISFPASIALMRVGTHKRLHADHRVETYHTPRGSTVFHCWGAGAGCGERWKVKNARVTIRA